MNIVYVYARKWPSKRPGVNFCTYTSEGLVKVSSDINVDLIVSNNNQNKSDYKTILKKNFSINPSSNFRVHLLVDANISHTVFHWKALKEIIKINKKNKIDVIITRNTNFLPYLYLLKKLIKTKIFFETHHFYLAPDLREKTNRKKETIFQKIFLPRVDGIICLQNIQKELYNKYIKKQNYCLARTGIRKVHKKNEPQNNNYIGYVGSLNDSKGVKEIFYSFKDVLNTNLNLLVVGGRNKKIIEKYEILAKELGIDDHVKITGWVDRKTLEVYLKKIKIGIVPARDTFYNRYITSPVKIFDYFSYGIPVIGSDLPTIREIVTDKGGLFYEKGNTKQLTLAIRKLNSSIKLYKEYSSFVKMRAKELTWEKRGKKLIDFFNSV